MFDIYDFRYDPILEWGALPEEPYFPEPSPPSPPQFDGTQEADPTDLEGLLNDFLNPAPPPLSEDQMAQRQEAFDALEKWFKNEYGKDFVDDFLSGSVTFSQLEQDFKNDLRDHKKDAWNAIWEWAEADLGIKDIRSDPFWTNIVALNVAKSIYGTSDGLMWDPAQGKIVPDPNYVPPSEADDENGSEDEDGWYDDGDGFVFYDDHEDWEDDDGGDWSVTVDLDYDENEGRDL